MANEVEKVVAGFTRLTDSEKAKAVELINEYIGANSDRKRVLKESYEVKAGLDLGPTNQGGCPCCGK
ncbi:MAG: hypothetical protein K9L59_17890 [Desulfobacterales bacterium]|nr:hypothetical protein [Desulfobacterales bacterium]